MSLTPRGRCTTAIIEMLQHPYDGEHGDVFNCDALMGSTEQCIFAPLRVQFDEDEKTGTVTSQAFGAMPSADVQGVDAFQRRPRGAPTPLQHAKSFRWRDGELLSDRTEDAPGPASNANGDTSASSMREVVEMTV